jgi:hypothetical protein
MGRRPAFIVLVASAALASSASATGDGIAMLLPGEHVSSTLAASGEKKLVAFAGVEGGSLVVDARALTGGGVKPRLTIVAPDGGWIDVGDTNPKSTGHAHCKVAKLGLIGVWRIGVETPPDAGGGFTLTTAGRVPRSFPWTAALDASGAPSDHVVPAAPGGTARIVVTSRSKPRFDPTVQLLSPQGGIVAEAVGVRGRATIVDAPLHDLGRYVVRVTGGVGAFKGSAVVKPAAKRAPPAFVDVESRPEIRGFSPSTTPNDIVTTITFDGFGFLPQDTVTVVAGLASKSAKISFIGDGFASAAVDLNDVPPGAYPLQVTTPQGNVALAAEPITVTNRAPIVLSVTPDGLPNRAASQLDVRGGGFDATSTMTLRHAADGVDVPFVISTRTAHSELIATVTPPAYMTGPCDLEVRDPDGSSAAVSGAVDLLGYSAAPTLLRSFSNGSAYSQFRTRDAAYDETNKRVLVSMQEGTNDCAFVLLDAQTQAVLDTLTFTSAQVANPTTPRVAWNPHDGTFALTCVGTSAVYARIVPALNIHTTLSQKTFGSGGVKQLFAAPNPDSGGYLLTWDDHSSATAKLQALPVAADGTFGTTTQTIAQNTKGYERESTSLYQGGGKFLVAWVGAANDTAQAYVIRATVVDASGAQTAYGPIAVGTTVHWNDVQQPWLAKNPNDGSMLLAYTYLDVNGQTNRPVCHLVSDPTLATIGDMTPLEGGALLPQGFVDSLVWDPNRGQFVLTATAVDANNAARVAVRRVNADGSLHSTTVDLTYEGIRGVLYTGAQPGSLGLARAVDGVYDDTTDTSTNIMQAVAGPFR